MQVQYAPVQYTPYSQGSQITPPSSRQGDSDVKRNITSARLEEGLWASQGVCGRICMICGVLVLMLGCWYISWDECLNLYRDRAINEARSTVQEQPCFHGDANVVPGTLLHLTNCAVSGYKTISSSTAGLEELERFEQNLPPNITGAWFAVGVQYNTRRRTGWSSASSVGGVKSVVVTIPGISIGDWKASEQVIGLIPGRVVPLKTAPAYVLEDTGIFGSNPANLSSENMESTPDDFLSAKDVLIDFSVGNASFVSVLASTDASGLLQVWNSSSAFKSGAQINQVHRGAVSSQQMISSIGDRYFGTAIYARLLDVGVIWLGTWMIIYPHYFGHCIPADERNDNLMRAWFSIGWAFLFSLGPIGCAFALAWVGSRFPIALFIVGGCLLPILLCAACGLCNKLLTCRCVGNSESSDEEEEQSDESDNESTDFNGKLLHIFQIVGVLSLAGVLVPLISSGYIYLAYMDPALSEPQPRPIPF